ncbi:MAG: zinc ABC transporter substrate-binding protein [Desulfuromonas sp.]|nr:zinc ABC transporter substrate-binding protein [Desulfuromonas sp.]
MISRISVLLLFASILCGSAHAQQPQLNILVSIAPQKYLVERIATRHAAVNVMIAAGQTPATWDPSPRKMSQLANTDILFCVGVPFESVWIPRLQKNFPSLAVVDPRQGIQMLSLPEHNHGSMDEGNSEHEEHHNTTSAHAHDHDHEHNALDPHIWLDPLRALQMAENMTQFLCTYDPDNAVDYQQGMAQLRQQFTQLHQQLNNLLKPCAGQQFMVFHPSWGYFAQRYQLHQMAIELSGKEPQGAKLAQITAAARAQHISTIFVQQQFSQKAAQTIATQINASVVQLDPLAEDLPLTLLTTAKKLRTAMEN